MPLSLYSLFIYFFEKNIVINEEPIYKPTVSSHYVPEKLTNEPKYSKRFYIQQQYEQALKILKLEQYSPIDPTNSTDCKDPSEKELQTMLVKNNIFRAIAWSSETDDHGAINDLDMDQSGCNNTKHFSLEDRSICPYKFVTIQKKNRYPYHVVGVKCTCINCKFFEKRYLGDLYKCVPEYEQIPVLVRKNCGKNGTYMWEYVMERVPKSCNCRLKRTWVNF